MLGGSGNGIPRRAGEWVDIVHMAMLGGGNDDSPEVQKFNDAAVREKLVRVREVAARAGRPPGAVEYATTIQLSDDRFDGSDEACSKAWPQLGRRRDVRHPITLVGTAEEIIDELRRCEAEQVAAGDQRQQHEQIVEFGEKIIGRCKLADAEE
jgi:alkanesulfonate monooxygenase SsuD/methylene tetrahydromethanopterin reductase-like flavin-dependent oxidoreductase (luciferase family)